MTMRSWPGKSNGTGDGSGSGSVGTPDKCPLCGTKDFEQLPAHLRDDCSGADKQLVTDGGTSPDDAGTVAWCPGCKRYIKSENETSHVRRKHLRSYPGEIQSRYRRVAHPAVQDDKRVVTDGGTVEIEGELTVAVTANIPADADQEEAEQALAESLRGGRVEDVDVTEASDADGVGAAPFYRGMIDDNERFQETTLGEAIFQGQAGYHTYYANDSPLSGTQTAMHKALDEVFEMIYLDLERAEERHGEATPQTVAKMLASEFDQVVGLGFKEPFVEEFEQALREQVEQAEGGENA